MGVDAAVGSSTFTEFIGCTTRLLRRAMRSSSVATSMNVRPPGLRLMREHGSWESMEEHETVDVLPPLPLLVEWLVKYGALTIPSAIDTSSFAQTATYSQLCLVGASLSNS